MHRALIAGLAPPFGRPLRHHPKLVEVGVLRLDRCQSGQVAPVARVQRQVLRLVRQLVQVGQLVNLLVA